MLGFGLTAGEFALLNDAGDAESLRSDRPVFERADALDLRSPCADDGRPGALNESGEPTRSGGADGDHGLPANAASTCQCPHMSVASNGAQQVAHLFPVLSRSPAMIGIVRAHSLLVPARLGVVRLHEFLEWRIAA